MEFKERLANSSRRSHSKVILALDITGPLEVRLEKAKNVLNSVKSDIAAMKLNMHLLLPFSFANLQGIIRICESSDIPVIADIKLNDIGPTNDETVKLLFNHGIDAIIANPFVGYMEGLSGPLQIAKKMDKGMILLVYMSHKGSREGYGMSLEFGKPIYRLFAERARNWDADGVIVSAKALNIIREVRGVLKKDQLIISPGVGAQGGDAQKALAAGSDYVIMGRSIIGKV